MHFADLRKRGAYGGLRPYLAAESATDEGSLTAREAEARL